MMVVRAGRAVRPTALQTLGNAKWSFGQEEMVVRPGNEWWLGLPLVAWPRNLAGLAAECTLM